MKSKSLITIMASFVVGLGTGLLIVLPSTGVSTQVTTPRTHHAHAGKLADGSSDHRELAASSGSNDVSDDQIRILCLERQSSLGARLEALRKVFVELAATDGSHAVRLAAKLLSPGELDAILPNVMETWAAEDPVSALEWYRSSLADGSFPGGITFDSKAALIESAFKALGCSEPEKAVQMVASLDTEAEWRIALTAAGRAAVLSGRSLELLKLSGRFDDEDQRFLVRSSVFAQWASLCPSDAVSAYSEILSGEDQKLLTSSVGHAWLRMEPEVAAKWWLENVSQADQGEAMREIVSQWGSLDPNRAAEWLNAQPESTAKDDGRAELAHNAFELDVESSLKWASSIQDSERRNQVWTNLLRTLYLRDQGYAKEILARSEISDACRADCNSFMEH